MEIKVLKNVMIKNDAIGNDNRDLFLKNKVVALNMLSSPGAGKTTLLENSLPMIIEELKTAIIEGDLYTSRDAERLAHFGLPIIQINTEGGCHLDASQINTAISDLNLAELDLVVVENVGNLVCPSAFDLGEGLRVVLYSVTEGVDKPQKYANMFESAHVVIINKVDLAEPCQVSLEQLRKDIRSINQVCKIFELSANKRETLGPWVEWLKREVHAQQTH